MVLIFYEIRIDLKFALKSFIEDVELDSTDMAGIPIEFYQNLIRYATGLRSDIGVNNPKNMFVMFFTKIPIAWVVRPELSLCDITDDRMNTI